MRLSSYAEQLEEPHKSRYVDKVMWCGGIDPLCLRDDETTGSISDYPKTEYCDVKDYLVNKTSFITRDQFKARKSLEAHNYLTSGWVAEPRIKVLPDQHIVIIGKVSSDSAYLSLHFTEIVKLVTR